MRRSNLWAGLYRLEFAEWEPPSARVYFVFVEDSSPVANPQSLEAPDASTFSPSHPVFEKRPYRFRTSGVLARDFLDWEAQFDSLVPGRITDPQRERRLGQLRDFFESVAIPVIDIYVSEEDEDFRTMRATLQPGTWHVAAIGFDGQEAGSYPVFSTPGRDLAEAGFEGGGLLLLAPVYPPAEERLRDIFSLNHIGDSDVTPEDGSDRAPMDPGHPPPARPAGLVETEKEYASRYGSYGEDEQEKARREQERHYEAGRAAEKKYLSQSH